MPVLHLVRFCYSEKDMTRGAHIALALLAISLLVRPFDCLSSGRVDQKTMECCKKGKCSPSNPDDCCKASVPDGNQFATSKAVDHSSPVLAAVVADVPNTISQPLVTSLPVEVHPPPGSPPGLQLNLPLLI